MRMNFKIGLAGEEPKARVVRPITLKQTIEHIRKTILDPEIQEEVVKRVSVYPANTLNVAINNLGRMIQDIKKEMRKKNEETGQVPEEG